MSVISLGSHVNVGAFFEKILWIGFGVYFIYLSIVKKEKLGTKAALIRFFGIGMVIYAISMILVNIFSAS